MKQYNSTFMVVVRFFSSFCEPTLEATLHDDTLTNAMVGH